MPRYELWVNGQTHSVDAEPETSLLFILREQLGLTGTKYGCGEAQCGACTVLISGHAKRSCRAQISLVAGKEITTIEGLAQGEKLHPVQQAFLEEGAMQCAFCTSGMIMSTVSLLNEKPHPAEQDILESMDGNICRCGTYPRIMAAIRRASGLVKEQRP